MHKILIADASEGWRQLLKRELEAQAYQVELCADGAQALARIRELQPEVVVLDLMLPRMDGLSLVRAVSALQPKPRMIVTGRHINDFAAAALDRFGVESVMLKPCTAENVVERVGELVVHTLPLLRSPDPFDRVTALLLSLNAPTSQRGFRYLRDGILLLMEDPDQQLTKALYPAIARKYDTSPGNVEKCIRVTVRCAWERRRDEVWMQYFPLAPSGGIPKPTAGQFLRRMTDVMTIAIQRPSSGR